MRPGQREAQCGYGNNRTEAPSANKGDYVEQRLRTSDLNKPGGN